MVQKLVQNNAEITLGYWGIRGLGQPIRLLLIAADVPFSEVRLGVLQDGTIIHKDKEDEDWGAVRSKLEMPFPNLPYLIDNRCEPPIKLSQSNAILRYLARQYDFYGDSENDRIEIDMLQDQAYDFRNEIIETAYTLGAGYADTLENFSRIILPKYLDSFEHYLSIRNPKSCFVGNRLSLVDFVLYELLWQMTIMVPHSISETSRPTLYAYIREFEQQPKIASYMKSQNYIEHPINSPWASFA